MLSRDLIATVTKTFFEELDNVRDGGNQVVEGSLYAGFYNQYFNKDRDWFIQAPVEDITAFLAEDPIQKVEMLLELLFRDARRLKETETQWYMYRKIIGLYEEVDNRSMEFSMERMRRVAEIKALME